MSIEAIPGLIDYWHDRYLHELCTRQRIIETLVLPMTPEEKLAEIAKVATWRTDG